ncbi:membrane protein [Pseudoclavibacter endophyticus]|uniref:PspA/IM30 family protein n=1 Tax=Pseudoclavibacter endophyticus TaxID=1778590 RepID=A0A6H9WQ95_9MICO|nr:PspA/IM30 family protein [Pseudoclavibacter endophyticus]KAB1649871.1 PspA/IM30 family protein [Pseudoclavibacter endophyticus]GGA59127.1 membrane protein [Pseudoclavibacter endophyticus]
MSNKQSIFGRISQLVRANLNALIDQAEDPEKMIDQLIRDFTVNIQEAEAATAQTIGNLRMLEDDHREDLNAAQEWGRKAIVASQRADEFRQQGNESEAKRFDDLAKVALSRQITSEQEAASAEPQIQAQTEVVAKLKDGVGTMRERLHQLTQKRNELAARAKTANAQVKVHEALGSINVMDPTSELGRFEDQVRRQEALARGQQELSASSLDSQFAELEDLGQLSEVELRLAALKSGGQSNPYQQLTDGDATA